MRLKKGPKKILLGLLIILVVIAVAGFIYYFKFHEKDGVKEAKILYEIKEYGYVLKDNKSKKYKEWFYELDEILKKDPVDQKKYVKQIAKMFILDFYSLDEKSAKTDVGGTDFVFEDILDNFLENAEDTLYKYVESNIYGQRDQQGLPTVKSIKITECIQDSFEFSETVDEEAFYVSLTWTYTDGNTDYQNNAQLVFVHQDKKLVLVQLKKIDSE